VGEADFIARFQRGDRASFDVIVDLHRARVVGLARRFLRDEHEALDVAQDAFVALHKVLPTWRPDAALFTWLYRTTVHLCARRLKQRGRVVPMGDRLPEMVARKGVDQSDLAQALDDAFEKLSEKQREVFLGCHEQGLTLDQVAARLGMAPGTARSHLHRALTTLRECLQAQREK
jgi:RNA polymerase sigma-70 factor (ECF subfamily)